MDVLLKDLDCSKMMVNVSALKTSADIAKEYPDIFAKHKEFKEIPAGISYQNLFRYLALVYDKNSPLKDLYPNDANRAKSCAAELAGFKKNQSGRFNDIVEKIFVCKNSEVNKMIVKYAVLSRSTLYLKYVVLSEVYQQESVNLLSGNKTKIDDFSKIGEELENVKTELLSHDNNMRLEQSFIDFYVKDKLELRPEDIAKKIQNGERIPKVKKEVSQD